MHHRTKQYRSPLPVALIGALIAATVLGAGVAWATYLSASDSVVNQLSISDIRAEVREDFTDPGALDIGDSVQKSVTVANTGTGDAYVRALVVFSDDESQTCTSVPFNTDDWTGPDADGYWYYNAVIPPSSSTTPLFEEIDIIGSPTDGWTDFDIFVYAEAVQAVDRTTGTHFASAQLAFQSVEEG